MVDRASPDQLRKALEVANLLVKMGVGFVPMPVANRAEFDALSRQSIEKLASMTHEAEQEESAAKPR